jgi:hypothetical protein
MIRFPVPLEPVRVKVLPTPIELFVLSIVIVLAAPEEVNATAELLVITRLLMVGLAFNNTDTLVLNTTSLVLVGTVLADQLEAVFQDPPLAPVQVLVCAKPLLTTLIAPIKRKRP